MATDTLDSSRLRSGLSRFGTGVCVVTVAGQDGEHGLTVNAFTAVSLDPPLVLVSIGRKARGHGLLEGAPFAVNVLGAEQETVARHFAGDPHPECVHWEQGEVAPRLAGALATVRVPSVALVRRRRPHALPGRGRPVRLPPRRRARVLQQPLRHARRGRARRRAHLRLDERKGEPHGGENRCGVRRGAGRAGDPGRDRGTAVLGAASPRSRSFGTSCRPTRSSSTCSTITRCTT